MIEQENSLSNLPQGWILAKISDFSTVLGGKRLPKGHVFSENQTEYPYIRVTDFDNMTVNIDRLKFLKPETQKLIGKYTISIDDVYISIAGSIGKVGTIPANMDGANLTENAAKIVSNKLVNKKALCYALNSPFGQEQIKKSIVSTNQPKLALFRIGNIVIPVPPLAEQSRIVSKLEELFTQMDAGVESLRKVKAQLKRYRQAVLKYAFEGKLTEEWRKTHRGEIHNFLQLEKDREIKIEKIPETWNYVKITDICSSIKKGIFDLGPQNYVKQGIPLLRISDIVDDKICLENTVFIQEEIHKKESKTELTSGDLVLSKVGTLNKIAIIPSYIKTCNISQNIIGIKLNKRLIYTKFLFFLLKSEQNIKKIISASHVTTLKALRLDTIKTLKVPLPPLSEQQKIIEYIELHFSICENIGNIVDRSLKETERLRQSVLKRAFKGKLVTQDPTDESAEKLLERIKMEKARGKVEERAVKKVEGKSDLKQMRLM